MPSSSFSIDAELSDTTPLEPERLVVLSSPEAPTQAFLDALKNPKHLPLARVEVLNSTSKAVEATLTDIVDEGTVTVDVTRGTRRTLQLRIVNDDGLYTPISSNDYFFFNRLIRVYRGLRYVDSRGGETDEYVLLGTFYVDRPEVFVERGMSVMTIDASDRWKKIATGGFPTARSYASGTHVNTIIRQIAIDCGLTDEDLNLDPLTDWATSEKQLGTTFEWELGGDRSQTLLDLCNQFGLECFFDVAGFLTTRPTPDPTKITPVWTFASGEDAVMLGVTKIQNDLKLINHLVVSGENSDGVFSGVRVEIKDTDPGSPMYVNGPLGDRFMHHMAPLVTTVAQATKVATKIWQENAQIEEEIKLPTICLPHLQGNDVIEVVEPLSQVNDRYLARRFDVALRETRQTVETQKGRALPA